MNDQQLRSLPFSDGQRDYPDAAVRGMFVRVGRKTKTFMLRLQHPRRLVSIGRYPDIGLAKAREMARDRLAEARLQKQPAKFLTFEAARQLYFQHHLPTMRPGSQKHATRILNTRFTAIEKRKLADITTSQLAACLDAIERPAEKHNAYLYASSFLRWCYRREYLEHNPLTRLKCPPGSQPRERVLSDDELASVWRFSAFHEDFGAYVRLLILSAQRKGQWLNFKPEYIQGDTIVFPGAAMKGKRPHVIPLTETLRSTIPIAFHKWDDVRKRRALWKDSGTKDWTLHDLRRTTATKMAELGVPPHIIERLLAHAMPGVAARYNRASYIPEMRLGLEQFETYLMELVRGRRNFRNVRTT